MKKRSIILEDNDVIRNLIADVLRNRGHEVFDFPNPAFCMAYLKNCQCPQENACADFIFTDIIMPEMTGLEFIEQQKNKGCKTRFFCIISSAWNEEYENFARRFGCKTFKKPLDIIEFIDWVGKCEKLIPEDRKLNDHILIKKSC